MADRFTVDAARLHVVPDDLDDTAAALIEPLSTPVHAIRLAGGVEGRTVAILGAGTIGLLVLAAARHQGRGGSSSPTCCRPSGSAPCGWAPTPPSTPPRPRSCPTSGTSLGESADVVLDCVAIQRTVDQAIQARRQGRHRGGRGRARRRRHDPAADRAGPPDPHPGRGDVPARGLRDVDRDPAGRRRARRRGRHRHPPARRRRRGLRAQRHRRPGQGARPPLTPRRDAGTGSVERRGVNRCSQARRGSGGGGGAGRGRRRR
nr:hypothetical protein [Angustibacter aerolatus]